MGRHYDLVVFDMDGVLTACRSSWGFIHQVMEVDNSEAYNAFIEQKIDESEFMRRDIALWKGVKPDISLNDIALMFRDMPLVSGIQETVACLHYNKIKCVICSGGIIMAAKMIAEEYGFDDYVADSLETDADGRLTGEGIMTVDLRDKGVWVKRFIEKYGTTPERTVSIGNSFTDISMFRNSGLSIAFNPIDEITKNAASRSLVSKNISDVLDIILEIEDGY